MVIKRKSVALMVGEVFAAAALLTMSAGVMAQATERVEITGSRISRADAETAAPVMVISRDDIEKSGLQTIADVIRSLPMDNNGSIPSSFGSGFAAGGSAVSLRGLGINSTLILLNGRRLAPYGLADDGQRTFTDLGSIPLDAVDRVEILRDGASAIYGSDAVGGVVNVILRSNYKGALVNVSGGMTKYKDGENGRVSVTGGWGDMAKDGFNLFFNVELSRQNQIMERDRQKRGLQFDPDNTKAGYDALDGGYFLNGRLIPGIAINGGIGGAVRSPLGGTNYKFLPCKGETVPLSPSVIAQYPGIANNFSSANGGPASCQRNMFDYYSVTPKEERNNFYGRGTWKLGSSWEAYSEFGYYQTTINTFNTPSSVSSSWPGVLPNGNFTALSNSGITIASAHPDNPFPGGARRLRLITDDLGGRNSQYETNALRFVAGARGTASNWDIDTALMYSSSETDIQRRGFLRNSVLRDYLSGTNLSGQNPTLTFYRLGVNSGLNSAATNAAISPTLNNSTKTSLGVFDFKASRELMKLDGGPLGLALGAEYRQEKLDSPATPFTDTGDIIGLGYAAFKAKRDVYALYGELVAPVTKTVELSGALRTDHYSDYGTSTTPKLGVKWQPVKPVILRGSYSEAFRAPGAAESGNSSSAGFVPGTNDPLFCPNGVGTVGCGLNVIVVSTGNPQIKPETSKSWNLGTVIEPWKQASMSIDFWRVARKNEITQASVPDVVAGRIPGGATTRVDDGLGNLVLASVSAPYFNASSLTATGFDVDARQRFTLGSNGQLTATLNWAHLNRYTRKLEDGTVQEYADSHGPTVMSGNGGMMKNRYTLAATWDYGRFSATGRFNYVGSFQNKETAKDTDCLNHFFDATGNGAADAPNNCKIPAFYTVDLFMKWKAEKNLEIYGSIKNLFDKVAPYDPQVYSAFHYNPIYHLSGAIGRAYNVGLKYQFQ